MTLEEYGTLVENSFKIQNWNYSKNENEEKTIFTINFSQDGECYTKCKVVVNQSGICDMLAYLPFNCPVDDTTKVAGLIYEITEYNFLRRYATIRFNLTDGTIRSSYSFKMVSTMTPEFILNIFTEVKDIDDDIYKAIKNICKTEKEEKQELLRTTASMAKRDRFKINL